jgi:hypothetical protein
MAEQAKHRLVFDELPEHVALIDELRRKQLLSRADWLRLQIRDAVARALLSDVPPERLEVFCAAIEGELERRRAAKAAEEVA